MFRIKIRSKLNCLNVLDLYLVGFHDILLGSCLGFLDDWW